MSDSASQIEQRLDGTISRNERLRARRDAWKVLQLLTRDVLAKESRGDVKLPGESDASVA